jgi:hypothetical protein
MTPRIKNCVDSAFYYQNEILQEISKHSTADTSDRSHVAMAFISMAVSDFKAILTEVSNDNPGPAFKTFRLLYEDVVNGLWTQQFGSDDLIDKLLNADNGELPGSIANRAAKLDTVFVDPADVAAGGEEGTLFVHFQKKFWKSANSYTHGGSMAIQMELSGYGEELQYAMLRSSMTLFLVIADAMFRLHHKKQNDALTEIANTYFAEKW